jgi:plastocyanin
MRTRIGLVFSATLLTWLAACSSSTGPSVGPAADVSIVSGAATKAALAFAPDTFTVSLASGGQVRWGNKDYTNGAYGVNGTTHTVTADGGAFGSGSIPPKGTYTFTFSVAGTYTYHCSVHPTMVGAIIVTP